MSLMIDNTPKDFDPIAYRSTTTLKRQILDRYIYPTLTPLTIFWKGLKYPNLYKFSFHVDRFLFGERGSGFIALTDKLKTWINLSQANILIQGCGLGQEALAWSEQGVKSCTGIDLFNFETGWQLVAEIAKPTTVNFLPGDFCHTTLPDRNFDAISSFAVWEHVKDFDALVKETHRLIKPDGVVLAAFGPLWYTFSGDHFSAAGGSECGFNHLLLDRQEYLDWIDSFQKQDLWATSEESYFEIRKHIHEGLFSYLRPREYIQAVEKSFTCLHTIAVVSPEALAFRNDYPDKWQQLLEQDSMLEEDLLIKGLILFLSPKELT
jgi:SAM-dependent methyltransferase